MSLSTFLTSPWQNGVYGFTLPLIEKRHECHSKLGQSEPPGRLPPAPGPYVDQRTVLPQELLWVYFWRPFFTTLVASLAVNLRLAAGRHIRKPSYSAYYR